MTDAEAERRYQHHLRRRRQAADTAEAEFIAAKRLVEDYEKNKEDYIAFFKLLP